MRNLSVIKGLYQGNGVTRRWAIPFEYNDKSQIFVTITTFDEGDYTYRVLDSTEYTIDEDSVEIVYPKTDDDAPIPSTQYLTVWRDTDLLQLMDLTNQGASWPDSIEASLDKLHQIVQELAEGLSRSLKVDIGDPQTPDEKLVAIQDYVLAAAESSRSASASEASAQRSAESAATSAANAAESERLASGYADTATDAASRAEDSAISARAYNAPDYDNEITYQAGDVVTFTDGNSYRALQETTGNEPPNIIYWQKVTDYVGDDFFEIDEYGYIVPMDSPSHSRYWRVDQNGYIVPIEGGDGGYRPDTRSLSSEYLNVTNEGYVKHLRADDVAAQEVDADEMTADVAAFNMLTTPQANVNTLTANAINAGTVTANEVNAGNVNAYLAESTGYGIVSGCEPSISGLTVSITAGIVHLASGKRKEINGRTIILDSPVENARIVAIYINTNGDIEKIESAENSHPVTPIIPSDAISICNVLVLNDERVATLMNTRLLNGQKNKINNPKLYIAHRGKTDGADFRARENTVFSLSDAYLAGFNGVEIDFRKDVNGKIVCLHNATVDGITDGTGNISELDYTTLNLLDKFGMTTNYKLSTIEQIITISKVWNMWLIVDGSKKVCSIDELIDIFNIYDFHNYVFFAYERSGETNLESYFSRYMRSPVGTLCCIDFPDHIITAENLQEAARIFSDRMNDIYIRTYGANDVQYFDLIKSYGFKIMFNPSVGISTPYEYQQADILLCENELFKQFGFNYITGYNTMGDALSEIEPRGLTAFEIKSGSDSKITDFINGNFATGFQYSNEAKTYALQTVFSFNNYIALRLKKSGNVQNWYKTIMSVGANATSAPTTGTYAKGDMVINSSPAPGGYIGWVCVTAGTPGTWKGFGLIQS